MSTNLWGHAFGIRGYESVRTGSQDGEVSFTLHPLSTGRHIRSRKETPVNNLWPAMLDRTGVPTATLGDSTGPLEGLS